MKNLLGVLVLGFAAFLLGGCGSACKGTSVVVGNETVCIPADHSTNYGQGAPYTPTFPTLQPVTFNPPGIDERKVPKPTPSPAPSAKTSKVLKTQDAESSFPVPFSDADPFSSPFFNSNR